MEDVVGRLDVERVAHQPRGMGGGEVERVEVVVHALDLGAFGDAVAEPEEHVLDLPAGARDQVQAADRRQRVGGQRHVDPVLREARVELGRRQGLLPACELRLELLTGLVRGFADGPALLLGQLGDTAQEVGQLGLAAEEAHPHVLQLLRARGGLDLGQRGDSQRVDSVIHAGAILVVVAVAATCCLVERDCRRHRRVERVRRDRDACDVVGRAEHGVGQARALGADQQAEIPRDGCPAGGPRA